VARITAFGRRSNHTCWNARGAKPSSSKKSICVPKIASELLKIDPDLTFKEKLDQLQNEGHISASERRYLDILTDAGSAAAHRGWKPTAEQLNTVMSIVETFIHRKFILESEVKRLKTQIPRRKKRKSRRP
jgi:hypothetical protein